MREDHYIISCFPYLKVLRLCTRRRRHNASYFQYTLERVTPIHLQK